MAVKQILVAIDQLVNTLLGGWADETLSSHAYRKHPRLERLIDGLLWFDKDHCYESYVSEQLRTQCPPEFRPKN